MSELKKLPFYKRKYWINPREQVKILITTLIIHYVTLGYLYLSINSDYALKLSSGNQPDIFAKIESIDIVFIWATVISSLALFMTLSLITNRIVGPIYRLTKALKRMNDGHIETIKFRKDDFFQDLAVELSVALTKIQEKHGNVEEVKDEEK